MTLASKLYYLRLVRLELIPFLLALTPVLRTNGSDNAATDRVAIEEVYHRHRIGPKKSFNEAIPSAQIEALVKRDARNEYVLKSIYHVEITPAMIDAEVQRINASTHAPEMLAEIKAALGNDPARFARSVARPIVVARTLRDRFDNDDAIHAVQRRKAEGARDKLKSGQTVTNLHEVSWELAPRPVEAAPLQYSPVATQGIAASQFYKNEATVQLAQTLNPPDAVAKDRKHYLGDLPDELQRVLKAQLNRPGDVSAVIETRNGFLVFRCLARDATTLNVASLAIPKRGYDEWLAQQQESAP